MATRDRRGRPNTEGRNCDANKTISTRINPHGRSLGTGTKMERRIEKARRGQRRIRKDPLVQSYLKGGYIRSRGPDCIHMFPQYLYGGLSGSAVRPPTRDPGPTEHDCCIIRGPQLSNLRRGACDGLVPLRSHEERINLLNTRYPGLAFSRCSYSGFAASWPFFSSLSVSVMPRIFRFFPLRSRFPWLETKERRSDTKGELFSLNLLRAGCFLGASPYY